MDIGSNKDPVTKTRYAPSATNDLLAATKHMATTMDAPADVNVRIPKVGSTPTTTEIPKELFDFSLVLNDNVFQVTLDTLLRIQSIDDIGSYSDLMLISALEKSDAYRVTCLCAHIAARRERKKHEKILKQWLATKQDEARNSIKVARVYEVTVKQRKEIGQITNAEVEDWLYRNHGTVYKELQQNIETWQDNEDLYLELRDTLKDRGTHLQTILRRVSDHTA